MRDFAVLQFIAGLDDIQIPGQETQRPILARNRPAEGRRKVRNKRGNGRPRQAQGDEAAIRMQSARRGSIRGQHAGTANSVDQLLAELRGAGGSAAQYADCDAVTAPPHKLARDPVVRGGSRADCNVSFWQQAERDIGTERRIADRLDIDTANPSPINLAPGGEAFFFGNILRGNPNMPKRLQVLHRPPGL
jgi:hypothetical protein